MKQCRYCFSKSLIKKGKRGVKQRYQCCDCQKYQQDIYQNKLYNEGDDQSIRRLNAEGVGIRSISRILGYSRGTIIRRILYLASKITRPILVENNQTYEVDEMWTYIGNKDPSNYSWIIYAINRRTRVIVDVAFGSRNKKNITQVIDSVKSQKPKKIITDRLPIYKKIVNPVLHDTTRYSNNRIERGNLTLRTHIKRLFRKTICYSKSQKMLEACVLLYFDFYYWRLKME